MSETLRCLPPDKLIDMNDKPIPERWRFLYEFVIQDFPEKTATHYDWQKVIEELGAAEAALDLIANNIFQSLATADRVLGAAGYQRKKAGDAK